MWKTIGSWFVRGALWCIGHPDTVKGVVDAIVDAKKK